jgi:hypothetical protein
MWKRIALFALLATFSPRGVFAVEEAPSRETAPPGRSLLDETEWLRVEVVGGRVQLAASRCGNCRQTSGTAGETSCHESLSLEVHSSTLTAEYERTNAQGRLSLSTATRQGKGTLTLAFVPGAGCARPAVEYVQPLAGDVQLTIQPAAANGVAGRAAGNKPASQKVSAQQVSAQKVSGASLWHLVLAEPELASEHLLPLLAELRSGWQLEAQIVQIEAALVASAGDDVLAKRQTWHKWVAQLSADEFATRQEAYLNLREAGQPPIAFLRSLDSASLDLEQRRRIRSLLSEAETAGADSPERVAAWLADDKRTWLALLSRGELADRVAAARHLSMLCGKPLTIDPLADSSRQQAQLAKMAALLAEK